MLTTVVSPAHLGRDRLALSEVVEIIKARHGRKRGCDTGRKDIFG